MSWYTDALVVINFNRKTYNMLYEVENDIDDCKERINRAKESLTRLAFITEPKKFCDDDTDPKYWIQNELNDALEELEEAYTDLTKLEVLRENWKYMHNDKGEAIYNKYDDLYKSQRINGDFIKMEGDIPDEQGVEQDE